MKTSIHVNTAFNLLRILRARSDSIGVAVSFGKDSLCTLDLCCQVFPRVEGYYLYRVAHMRVVEDWSRMVKDRWGVTVRPYPHFDLSRCYRYAVLAPHRKGFEKTPKISMADIELKFRADANVDFIAYGWRRNDSFSRALIMKKCAGLDDAARRVFPLRAFSRAHVFAYLKDRNIPLPEALGRKEQGGLDFHREALAFLRDHYPDDWERWQRDFPFAGLQLRPKADEKDKTELDPAA
jgi:3'-phosphoadenosine 5'-phosphosulfate sulfotransferase (PAPS reductase)/FAD synthetase